MLDLFKFEFQEDGSAVMTNGQPIQGQDSTAWIERYRNNGEFVIEAPLHSGLYEYLPRGTQISHVNTLEIMTVEDHQIAENRGEGSKLKVTGRSLESFLENRPVGGNTITAEGGVETYPHGRYHLRNLNTWNQIAELINAHIIYNPVEGWLVGFDGMTMPDDAIPGMYAIAIIDHTSSTERAASPVEFGTVYERAVEGLAIDDLGIRVVRPGGREVALGAPDDGYVKLVIHDGKDRTSEVNFSWAAGDIENADYLWSGRTYKNDALTYSTWMAARYGSTAVGLNRRIALIDARDLDDWYEGPLVDPFDDILEAQIQKRAGQFLWGAQPTVITRADIAKTTRYQYRRDYDIGDIVAVTGNYGETTVMRVTEFAEFQDRTEISGHPTLSAI